MKAKHIPNIITTMRFLLVVPFLFFLLTADYDIAFYIFLIAGLSDGVDGFLARQFNWTSRFGAFLDPLADKLLMMSSFIAIAWLGLIPLWLCAIVILRDIVIMSGVGGIFYAHGHVDFEPSLISKLNTCFQVLLVCLILFKLAFLPVPDVLINSVMAVVSLTTILSLLGYAWEGLKQMIFVD